MSDGQRFVRWRPRSEKGRSLSQERDARKGVRVLAWLVGAVVVAGAVGVWVNTPRTRPVRRDERMEFRPVTRPLAFPAKVAAAPSDLRELYEFAARRPDVLHYVPCFCGCWRVGHKSSYDCFIDEVRADGTVLTDDMSFT